MIRHSRTALAAAGLVALGLWAGAPARGENADWAKIAKEYGEQFKVKADVSLKQKRTAVNALAKSKDGRAIDLLLGTVDDQQRFAGKLRKDWQEGENAWREKTDKLEKRVEAKRKQAKERGEDSITVDAEEAEWLGSNSNPNPKMYVEKEKLAKKYYVVLDEEKLAAEMLRAISRVLNTLEGEELTKASAKATSAATSAKPERRIAFLRAFGYGKGDTITTFLESQTKELDVETVQVALESLGRQNAERGADILIAKLDDARWQVRASAITGLSFFRNGKVVGKVMDALLERGKKEEGVLQRNFFVGMARIVQESVPATIEAWESWWKANREDFLKKIEAREDNALPLEDDPPDVLVETNQGSSSFYGITTNSKHVIYVVDISGSMNADAKDPGKENADPDSKKRIDIAREELKKAINGLTSKEGDERGEASFNIVIFSTDVEVYKPGKMVDATKTAKEAAMKWIDEKIQCAFQTNIYDAIEQAFNVISASSDAKNLSKGADTIFLMTDGGPNRGKFIEPKLIIEEVKRLNAVRKITLHTIGVGEGHLAGFLQQLAAANGGQYIGR